MTLRQGAVYSVRVGAVNKAGFMAAFETNGVKIDITPPIVSYLLNTLPIICLYTGPRKLSWNTVLLVCK